MNKSKPDKPSSDPRADIGALRQAIDKLDRNIMGLINQRLLLARQIGGLKKQGGIQIADSKREKEILNRLLKINRGPLGDDGLRRIFAAIIAEGRRVQKTDRKPK